MNALFDTISAGFDNTLSLDGTTPNSLSADIDLNSNDLLNVGSILAQSFKDSAGNSISLADVNALGAIVDDIVAVNDNITAIQNAVTNAINAAASADAAAISALAASSSESAAAASAADAAISASNAVSASLTPAAGLIPLADGTGKIANGWLPNNPTFSGEIEANGGIVLGNNDVAQFGSIGEYGDGLQIYHDGYVAWFDNQDLETKETQIKVPDGGYISLKAGNDSLITAVGNANVSLFHDNSAKLATTATGIVVNGEGTFSNGVYLGGSAAANHLDNYEEGTFAITNAGDATGTLDAGYTSHYTKVGNLVTVTIAFNPATNFTSNIVDGLPYVVNTPNLGNVFSYASNVLGDLSNTATAGVANGLYRIYFFQNQALASSFSPQASAGVYRVTFSYKTL